MNNKPYQKGFLLGKFMPVHRGHIHLIETAAAQTEELTVLMCSVRSEPIPGALRYAWMKQLFPKLRVLHVTDENPQTPDEHKFFWEIWLDTFRRHVPDAEVVFSSESYGDEIARRMGIRHVLVDQPRKTVPISATMIRQHPFQYWDYIPPPVRPYYVRKVVLTGPESVGKSTLARQLAQYFGTSYVPEYGRSYTEQNGLKITPLDIVQIAGGQLLWEDEAAMQANRLLFCDTDLMVTQIWAEIYCGGICPPWVVQMSHQRHYDLYLLLDIDLDWDDDGTREFPHLRQWHFNRLREELESRNCRYVVISGRGEARVKRAIEAVDSVFAGSLIR